MHSLWTDQIDLPHFPSLNGHISTDVLIIGGGMAGLLCAWELKQRGIDYLLVEGKTIGSGITAGTTAVITAQHDLLYSTMIAQAGAENAHAYLHANLRAVEAFKKLAQNIPCDFEIAPSVMYSRTDKAKMEKEARAVNTLGFPAEFTEDIPLPFSIAGGVRFCGQAQFHPLKFMAGIAAQLNILEHTFVREIKGNLALTDEDEISAKHIIIATHFPFINRCGMYFSKLYQQRSYVIALENASPVLGTYADDAEDGMYVRSYKDLLLIGGGDHRTGKSGGNFRVLRDFAKQYYPAATEKYAWATQDCMSLDGIPYIGRYSSHMPQVYVLTGFNEWGMTSSMVGAHILADLIEDRKNAYAAVFAPDRSMLKKQLFINMGTTLGHFFLPTVKRCPHMGCALTWNKAEHSWDCACHGSRFESDGKLIDNPAMKDSHL